MALIPVLSEALQQHGRPAVMGDLFPDLKPRFYCHWADLRPDHRFCRPLIRYVIAPGFPDAQQELTDQLMQTGFAGDPDLFHQRTGDGWAAGEPAFLAAGDGAGSFITSGRFSVSRYWLRRRDCRLDQSSCRHMVLGIYGLVYGVILGAVLHLAIQVPGLIWYKFRWTPAIGMRDPGLMKVLRMLGPRVATMFFLQIFFIARDNLASRLGEGTVTALNYGWFIMQVPETLIGSALAIALLPTLSEIFSSGKGDDSRKPSGEAVSIPGANHPSRSDHRYRSRAFDPDPVWFRCCWQPAGLMGDAAYLLGL